MNHPHLLVGPLARLFIVVSLLSLAACSGPEGDSTAPPEASSAKSMTGETAREHWEKHQDPTYVCPMHPQIVRNEEDSCPICGMDLVLKEIEPEAQSVAMSKGEQAKEHWEKHQDPTYVCPMHPQIVRNEEGSCPICGMDLVLTEVSGGDDEHPEITVSAQVINNMGVRTTKVERGRLWKRIDTVGRVLYDEDRVVHLHPRAPGWVEELDVRAVGDTVQRNRRLMAFYSPEIVNAQEELVLALAELETGRFPKRAAAIVDSAKNKLRLYDVPNATIRAIEKTRKTQDTIPVLAPADGVVTQLAARDGMYVTPSMEMFTIADVSTVWVLVDVFEHQMEWVKQGLSADIEVAALPGRTWEGQVDYIYPELDPVTRTLRVRLRFDNADGALKPNMLADAVIWGGPADDVLYIPREALIETGENQRVVKATGKGTFKPILVNTGMRSGGSVEILGGIKEGDEIVVSGQFLIDSESNLQASFRRMSSQ
ncbi:MAG: efflux RND transporter periplasmic adaptor subunit [Gammaproteobacteria bacterium]